MFPWIDGYQTAEFLSEQFGYEKDVTKPCLVQHAVRVDQAPADGTKNILEEERWSRAESQTEEEGSNVGNKEGMERISKEGRGAEMRKKSSIA